MATMQAESLEVLENANVPPGQARAIVRAIEIEIGGAKDVLATKSDIRETSEEIHNLRHEMKQEIQAFRHETKQEIQTLRQETKQEIQTLRQETKQETQTLRQETRQEFQTLRHEMAEIHRTLDVRIESVRTEIHSVVGSSTRQLFAVIIGAMTAVLGGVYFMLIHVAH